MIQAESARRSTRWQPLLFLVICLSVFYLATGLAKAAQQAITMTPTSVSPVINPGSSQHGSFKVINQGKTAFKFITYAAPYRVSGEDYTPEFTVLPTAPNITGWFNFSAPGGTVEPNQAVTIGYTITIPENVQPGGYYAAAFAETQYPKAANSIVLNERVGELFYIQVAGPVVKKGEMLTWKSGFFQKPPLTSVIRLQNSGSIHFPSTIKLTVKDILGHTKYQLTTQKELLPQTIRRVTIPWDKTPSIGLFKVSGDVTFLNQHQKLSTKWVLVMSNTARLIVLIILVPLILLLAARYFYIPRRRAKTNHRR